MCFPVNRRYYVRHWGTAWSEEGNRSSHQSGATTATNILLGVWDDEEMVAGIPTPVTGTTVAIVMEWTDGLWSVRSS